MFFFYFIFTKFRPSVWRSTCISSLAVAALWSDFQVFRFTFWPLKVRSSSLTLMTWPPYGYCRWQHVRSSTRSQQLSSGLALLLRMGIWSVSPRRDECWVCRTCLSWKSYLNQRARHQPHPSRVSDSWYCPNRRFCLLCLRRMIGSPPRKFNKLTHISTTLHIGSACLTTIRLLVWC